MRARYHKYKGRYADLAKHYQELEREKEKVKTILADSQDRSLRRISELKEQCGLEQQAKAHLEENLRSDLEEKDNMITVLQTKVKLLSSGSLKSTSEKTLIDLSASEGSIHQRSSNEEISGEPEESEVKVLREKLTKFESLLIKCKENIKFQKERVSQLQTDNEAIKQNELHNQNEIDKLKELHRDQLSQLTDSLNLARQEIETLSRQEQDAALASAETKQKVHEELLKQEGEMIKLRAEREKLLKEVKLRDTEIVNVTEEMTKQLQEAEMILETEKQKLLKELSRGKTEALKLMDEDMDIRLEELRKEKDAEIDTLLKIKLGEAKDDHQRLLRLAEAQYRSRLSELQEEKDLVLEEKELRCQSLITQHQNNQQGIQEELSMLKQELDKKEKAIEKIREEG